MAKSELKNRIRRLRFDHGEMTQEALAQRVNVTRQTIIALEAGKYSPSLPLAFRIARVFGVPVEQVFQYQDQDAGPTADRGSTDDRPERGVAGGSGGSGGGDDRKGDLP